MASVFKRGTRWYAKYKDPSGRWRTRPTTVETKQAAKRLSAELEQNPSDSVTGSSRCRPTTA